MNPIIAQATSSTRDGPWVSIVDDDSSLRLALARALRGKGIRVEVFGSAEEYLDRPPDDALAPACIVLDIRMCGLSGFDLQDALVARGKAPPIIFITSHDGMLAEAARARAQGCLIKPFETDALLAMLRPHLAAAAA